MEATSDTVSQAEATVALAAETLRGDIRDKILDDIARDMPCWTKLSEREQKKFIARADDLAYQVVREATKLVAHQGFAHLTVSTGKWSVKDGIKLEVNASSSVDDITKLASHGSGSAVLVLAEASVFYGQRADALADKDQPEMDLSGDGSGADEEGEAEGVEASEADHSPLPEPPTAKTRSRRAPADADA